MSVTWYTWLEQGRNINVSGQVLNSIARTLGLTPTELRYLHLLAGLTPVEAPGGSRNVAENTVQFLRLLDPCPSWVFNSCFDIIAWNRSAAALLVDIEDLPANELNAVWLMFTDPRARLLLPEWENEARRLVGMMRAESAQLHGNPRFARLMARLMDASPSFREMWEAHDVVPFAPSVRRFNHPRVGTLTLSYVKFSVSHEVDQNIISHFALPGTAGYARLLRLVRDDVEVGASRVPLEPAAARSVASAPG